jgi:ATP-dependent helicase/nuclease subunit B
MVFLKNSKNNVNILPIMKAMGDVDDESILLNNVSYDIFKNHVSSTKIVSHLKYRLLLLSEIMSGNSPMTIEHAINLAKELDAFVSDMEKYEIKFSNLANLIDDSFAMHWQQILYFLKNFGERWQNLLKTNDMSSVVGNIIANIKFYTSIFEQNRPKNPVLLAGNFDFFNSTVNFIKSLAKYDNTYFIFKGLENILSGEEFSSISECHSHMCFRRIIEELTLDRKSIESIEYPDCREIDDSLMYTIYSAALPPNLTYRWLNNRKIVELTHVEYLECNDDYDEYNMIMMYLLDYLANNGLGNIAMIVDLEWSYKMELFLEYWNVPYNNAYGKKIIHHSVTKYMLLIVDVYNSNYRQDRLLGLLKHNFTHFGYSKKELSENIELFENNVSLGNNTRDGMKSYRKNIEDNVSDGFSRQKLQSFLDRIEDHFRVFEKKYPLLSELIEKHLALAERIASSDSVPGSNMLWYSDDGSNEKVFEFFSEELLPQPNCFENVDIDTYSRIFNFLISEKSYSNNYSIHPTVNLISMSEARLINYDLVIITNLNEGSIPQSIPADPWLSRKMRVDFGLPPREISLGNSYFDFIQLLAQKKVLLTRSKRVKGALTLKSRFLQRLEIALECNGLSLRKEQQIIRSFSKYYSFSYNMQNDIYKNRPRPKPPFIDRPRNLSATNINLLSINPYDIYAKKILNLSKKSIIGIDNIYAKIGTLLHSVFEQYCKQYDSYRDDKLKNLVNLVQKFLSSYFAGNRASMELYLDKTVEVAKCFLDFDNRSREQNYSIIPESYNIYDIPNKNFKISARIDRIETLGNKVRIVDYKTGTVPSKNDILNGRELQLPLEALILSRNKIDLDITSLQYWLIKHRGSKVIEIADGENVRGNSAIVNLEKLMVNAENFVVKLIDFFDNEANGYTATNRNVQYSDFNHLSRVEEWLYELKPTT